MQPIKTIFIIGGTGAQGIPVVEALSASGTYALRVLTRDAGNHRARRLAALPYVELVVGTFSSEATLRSGFSGCDGAHGRDGELYWGFRSYELARECGVKFYVWASLDYGYKKGGYDARFRCGHYDGKGRIAEWILSQPRDVMGAAVFTTGPYMDMITARGTPMAPRIVDGVATWAVPLGAGAVPHIALADVGHYVRWMFEHPERVNGMDLEVATEHVHYAEMAAAFTRVTGREARYVDVGVKEYFDGMVGAEVAIGGGMTVRENFGGFWELWRESGGNNGVVRRDYALLDEIHPGRIRSVEEWFAKQEGLWERVQDLKPVLKLAEDRGRGAMDRVEE